MSNPHIILPDYIGPMGGTRSFLLRLIGIHSKNDIQTVVALQRDQIDDNIIDFCGGKRVKLYALPNRSSFFRQPYFSLVYDLLIYLIIWMKFQPKLIVTSIGTPRLFLGLFFFKTPLLYYMHTYPISIGRISKPLNLINNKKMQNDA